MAAVCQGILVVAFLGAALAKLGNGDRFLRALTTIPWLSLSVARVAARAVPMLEVTIAVLLIALPRVGAVLSAITLTLFTMVIGKELAGGRKFACGCFGGAAAHPVGPGTVIRNLLLIALSVVLVGLPYSFTSGAVLTGVGVGFSMLLVEIGMETLSLGRKA